MSQLVSYCSNPSNSYGCSNYTLQGATLYYGGTFGELPSNAVNNNAIERGFLIQTAGCSFYDGLEVTLTERPWHGLQAQLAYTWSHALDDSSDADRPTERPAPGSSRSLARLRSEGMRFRGTGIR